MTAVMEHVVIADLESDVICQFIDSCENAAAWRLVTTCCKRTFPICTSCKVKHEEVWGKVLLRKVCSLCNANPMPKPNIGPL